MQFAGCRLLPNPAALRADFGFATQYTDSETGLVYNIFLLVYLFLLLACGKEMTSQIRYYESPYVVASNDSFTYDHQISLLESSVPAIDAMVAYGQNDTRLIGILGISVGVPGITIRSHLLDQLDLKILWGTTDNILDPRQEVINQKGYQYALEYNEEMIALLVGRRNE